ncbi:MAG: hypothetical protein ABIN67_16930 [Ferruginibacter sp.]
MPICLLLLNTRLLHYMTSSFINTSKNCLITPSLPLTKAYINYEQFDKFTERSIYYVTRQKENADYKTIEEFDLAEDAQHILKDERIEVSCKVNKEVITQQMRRVAVFSPKYQKAFVYTTNNFNFTR